MSNYTVFEKYMDKCDSCYSEAQVQIEKTVYDTICGDAVKICVNCCLDEEPF